MRFNRVAPSASAMAAVVLGAFVFGGPAAAMTIEQALVHAYRNNPDLAAARAAVRIANEGVPSALSGYRPSLSATISAGAAYSENRSGGGAFAATRSQRTLPRSVTLTGTQTLYDGNRTANTVRVADQNVLAQREVLRNVEQTVLAASAAAFMNVLQFQAVLDLRKRNVDVLQEQLRATRDRFAVGEVTRTDVALSESSLQQAIAVANEAQSDLANARAIFFQQIGVQPNRLQPARTVERLHPRTLDAAIQAGQSNHPSVRSARHNADAGLLEVRVAEGALYPTLALQAALSRGADQSTGASQTTSASVVAQLTIPIFADGGRTYSTIRRAKETAGQRRIQIDTAIATVRQATVQSWAALEAARARIQAAQAQVRAAEIALNGVREEYRVGQRTILDVLTATQSLTEARVSLVRAQRDRVVQSYNVLVGMGRLDARTLALRTEIFDPTIHYNQVRDLWLGVRTPDGR